MNTFATLYLALTVLGFKFNNFTWACARISFGISQISPKAILSGFGPKILFPKR